ncbi:hypothetical protein HAX54_048155 [Datura stramonium]|uniref:Pentatricopeptide repeat-containing protein n=1 Tax=Datura stramonium TaxID=4076 RepID=A0ABS8STB6_DATST|nr:hypothetical protein [Datura stramonium]
MLEPVQCLLITLPVSDFHNFGTRGSDEAENQSVKNRCSEGAVKFFEKMMVHKDVKHGLLKPNEASFVSILSSCTFLDVGMALYLGMKALKAFDAIVSNQVCTWNGLISSVALNGREKHAVTMYEKMRGKGLQPKEITFKSLLTSF